LGSDLADGEYNESGLAQAFRTSMEGAEEEITFVDYAAYAPSGGEQAAFMAGQVTNITGTVVGVMAIQVPTSKINAIVQERVGMGDTGETYLAAKDDEGTIAFRSDLLTMGNGEYVVGYDATDIAPAYLKEALNGQTGHDIYLDSNGKPVIVSYEPLDVEGANWAMVSKIDAEEAIVTQLEGREEDYFTSYAQKYGYHDVFLITARGDVFYSVSKEADYQTNMVDGQFSSSNLGELTREVLESKAFGFADFEPYAPSNGAPAAFVAQPELGAQGNVEIVVALQLPLEGVNSIVSLREGMGETGESYLVGPDNLMRSDSYLDQEGRSVTASFAGTVEENGVDTEATQKALAGESGLGIITDYNGHHVLSSYGPVEVYDTTWALVSDIDQAEVSAPSRQLRNFLLAVAGSTAVVVALVSFFVATSIANPIQLITQGAERISIGDAELEGMDANRIAKVNARGDELGDVGRAFDDLLVYFKTKAAAAEGIAQGDLSVDVPVASEEDVLGKAMVQMKESLSAMASSVNGLIKAAVGGKLDTRADATEFEGEYREIVDGVNQTLDAVIGPLNVAAEYVDRISKGDIPEKITDDYNGDFNEIKNNLNLCIDSINGLVAEMDTLTKAGVEGRLDTRGDTSNFAGDFAVIVQGVNDTLDAVIGPLNVAAEYVDRISKGDIPEKITDDYNGDFNEIKNNLNVCIDAMNGLVAEADMLTKAAVEGRLDTRGDAGKFTGDFGAIVQGVNDTLDAVIGPLNVAAEYVDRISKGDIPEKITDDYNGDFNEIKNNLNVCIDAMNGLVAEADMLTKAAVEGRLDTRGDAGKFTGDFGAIVQGVNDTLDAVIGPLNVAAEYVDRISKGDIPEKITDDYNGDFNEIKNNLNVCIDSINGLVAEADMLTKAAVEGRLDTRGDAGKFAGDFAVIVQGVNDTLDAVIGPLNVAAEYVDRISKGDIPERITDDYNGDFNEIKNNLNLCIDAIEGLVAEMDVLTDAAVEGRLDVRGQVDKFGGDFGAIVSGVNDTVDSLVGFLDAVPAPFMVIDKEYNVQYLNQTGASVVGKAQKETLGAKCYNLFNTGDCQTEKCALRKAMTEIRLTNSETQARINGNVLDIAYDGVPLMGRNGDVIGALEIVTDQTAIKRAARRTQRIAEFQQQEVEKLQGSLNALADGDLRQAYDVAVADEDTEETREAFAAIAEAFNKSVVGLKAMAGQMQEGAMNISSATSEILASSSQMASTTKEQASAVTEVTSTVEEIQSSAEQVAQRAQGVAEAAQQAARAAQDGSMAADEAIAAMGDIRQRVDAIAENILSLSEQTQQIGEIIDTVTDIADQSNILALNAAIEAAQAGEAGKGFRVVADEVRSLAEQSRQAAAQVKVILGDIQEASNRAVMATEQGTKQVAVGSDQVERTAQTIRELAATVEQSSSASEQIVAGVQQQTVGLDQIAVGMMDINQAAQQAAAGADQSEKAAQDLDTLGADLEAAVEQYKM